MKKLYLLLGAALILLAIPFSFTGMIVSSPPSEGLGAAPAAVGGEEATVERVIDGDTLVLEGGERVRLIGVDTPEKGQHLFEESTAFVRNLVEGKDVILKKDVSERDKYERLLRYVFVDGLFLNKELLERGYASTLFYEPDTVHKEEFLVLEEKAREQEKGIWAFSAGDYCLGIFSFHFNARGDDNENLNDEYVVFRNKCFIPIELTGWTLRDAAGTTYTFPNLLLQNKTKLTLHTGQGHGNKTNLFWGMTRAVWNNAGDTLFAFDANGKTILNHSYKGYS